jgi:VWFA-related protein
MRISSVVSFVVLTMCGAAVYAQVPSASPTIKTNTRLITVDVVATDSHGNVVRGLTENDFKVYEGDGLQQYIARFEFVDARMRQTGGSKPNAASGGLSNLNAASEQISPTVILMDALNTETKQQMAIRREMLLFLEKLPPNTPVAVLLLEHRLRVVQDFTTDPAMLRAALGRVVSPTTNEKYAKYDPDSMSNLEKEGPRLKNTPPLSPGLEDAEKREYEAHIQERAEETAEGMTAIAKYLSGFPGRKNLIWFSEAFPIWIEPNPEFGSELFAGTGSYQSEVQAAAASLMDSGVAVYPTDARELQPDQVYSAEARPAITELGQAGAAGALKQENDLRMKSQATLRRMAYDTGGRACENTNDLAGCAIRALFEDSSYYEISYYPTNVKWDKRFHKITIKTSKRGIQLDYRRGYIATNSLALTKSENPDNVLTVPRTRLDFRLPSGTSGSLDWSEDKLIYEGDLDSVVPAVFNSIYSPKFHCDAGKLTPNEPNDGSPTFQLSFHSPSGLTEVVNFGGNAPVYSGNLPVDASAKSFFALLWKYCHCEAP